jgi:hypothetical protein
MSGLVFGATAFGIWISLFMLWCFVGGMIVIILPVIDFKNDLAAAAALNAEAKGMSAKQ